MSSSDQNSTNSFDHSNDQQTSRRAPSFDMSVLPAPPSRSRRVVRQIDIPVQLARVVLLVLLLLFWQLIVDREWVNRIFMATPGEVWDSFWKVTRSKLFWEDVTVTLKETVAGFVFGGSLGLLVGLLTGRYTRVGKVFSPFLTFANALPKIAFAPIFLLWFGVGEMSKIVLASVVVFFIVQVPTHAAVGLVEPDLRVVADSMKANEFQKFSKIILPGILAPVFGAFRLAAIFSLLSVVFAEILGAKRGLGLRLITAKNNFDIGTMFAYTIILALIALSLNGIIGLLERKTLRWQDAGGRTAVLSI